jgi:hypothetical protein
VWAFSRCSPGPTACFGSETRTDLSAALAVLARVSLRARKASSICSTLSTSDASTASSIALWAASIVVPRGNDETVSRISATIRGSSSAKSHLRTAKSDSPANALSISWRRHAARLMTATDAAASRLSIDLDSAAMTLASFARSRATIAAEQPPPAHCSGIADTSSALEPRDSLIEFTVVSTLGEER